MIRHVIDGHVQPIPSVLEIPSKDHPYDASKDSILRRAKVSSFILYINCRYKNLLSHNLKKPSYFLGFSYIQAFINH